MEFVIVQPEGVLFPHTPGITEVRAKALSPAITEPLLRGGRIRDGCETKGE